MKLLSYAYRGVPSWGALYEDRVVDLRAACDGAPTLRAALTNFSVADIERLAAKTSRSESVALADVDYLPVIPDAPRIFCIGLNYDEHRLEANRETTAEPTVFLRVNSSQIGHGEDLLIPPESGQFDYEGEIAIVIAKAGRRIDASQAWEYVDRKSVV